MQTIEETVLSAVRAGCNTVKRAADFTGLGTREVLRVLNTLRDEGKARRTVDVDGYPVARWRAAL